MTTPTETPAGTTAPAAPTARHRRIWSGVFSDLDLWVKDRGTVPRRRTADPEEYRLANWLNVQRTNHRAGKLHQDYIDQLQEIHGALETRRTRTHREWAEDIAAFHKAHGRMPSSTAADPAERSLGHYVADRLRPGIRSGDITNYDCEPLAGIPGAIGRLNRTHRQWAEAIAAFHEANGRMPSSKTSDAAERSLGNYIIRRLRPGIRSGAITQNDYAPVADLPGAVSRARKSSSDYFQDLLAFAAAHGRMPGWKDARPLAAWVRRVRNAGPADSSAAQYLARVEAVAENLKAGQS
ncbi:helicase associated domain-containing protein [Arthrobacter sp. IK3]|uniref:helicase associated domain-containing protein n=1 Tax=Arthrobacter sp. IK3 TaxID=3448169 RepID=UPI003EE19F85